MSTLPRSVIHSNVVSKQRDDLSHPKRVNVLGVGVHAVNMDDALQVLRTAVEHSQKGLICVTGVHGVMESQRDPRVKSIINKSLLTIPDGRPMMWVGRLTGHDRMTQVTGPDFMLAVCGLSVPLGYSHFLYGGKPGIADELKHCCERKFPGIRIVGTYTPPFRPLTQTEQQHLCDMVSDSRPDIIWVGISTPKQEFFMAEYLNQLDTKIMVGVGAAFDLHTGHLKDSPQWVKAAGMQWFHRLLQDPARLWRRYLLNSTSFLWNITLQLLRLKTFDAV
jgi:N-acetylglucosaminyldiphosphoundecaprenol N-acetyl-beta-D-mannosaminyltransferase